MRKNQTIDQNIKSIRLVDFIKIILRPYVKYILALLGVATLWSVDLSLRPYLVKIILDRLSSTPANTAWYHLVGPLLLFVSITIISLIVYRLYDWVILRFLPALKKTIVEFMMDHMLKHSHSYYQNSFSGSLVNKINDVAYGMREILIIGIDRFFGNFLALLIATFVISTVHPMLAVIMMTWLSIYFVVSLYCASKSHHLSDQLSETNSSVMGQIVDILMNMAAVRLFSSEPFEKEKLRVATQESFFREQRLSWFLFYLATFQGFSFLIMETACIAFLIYGRTQGFITVGDFGLIITINIHIMECLWNLSKDFSDFSEHMGRITQGLRLTTAPIEIVDVPGASPLRVEAGKIEFDRVTFHYKYDSPLFKDLSITIHGGEKIGLVGFSGSGKSTFASLILRIFDIQSGFIKIDGQNISEVTQDSLRQGISMIPQDPILFHRSIMDNIRYGKLSASDEEVVASAQKANIHDFIQKQPLGYHTIVGDRGIKISGGQRQRIAIARAFLKNSPILILDEATSALDSVTEEQIQNTLFKLMQEKTTLIIAHRLSTLLYMDRILVFDKGTIVEEGTHQQLLEQNGFYARLWEAQISGFLPEYNEEEIPEDLPPLSSS